MLVVPRAGARPARREQGVVGDPVRDPAFAHRDGPERPIKGDRRRRSSSGPPIPAAPHRARRPPWPPPRSGPCRSPARGARGGRTGLRGRLPGRPRKVEKLAKKSAKPTVSPATSARITSAAGWAPNRWRWRVVGGRDHLVRQLFVACQLADQVEDRGRIIGSSRPERGRWVRFRHRCLQLRGGCRRSTGGPRGLPCRPGAGCRGRGRRARRGRRGSCWSA